MYWFQRLFRKNKVERQLDSELSFHLEQVTEAYIQQGLAPDEAARQARIEFGGVEGVKEECRESRRVHLVETFLQDVRYGLRSLIKNPGFSLVAILTLALGIGANTAIFSVVNAVLLNPLPFPHPEELVALHESKPNFEHGSISYPNFVDWKKGNHSFAAMAIARETSFSLTGIGDAEQVRGLFVSTDFFPMLGVNTVIGRTLVNGEDVIGGPAVAMIHDGLWQRKFGGAHDVLGKSITLDGRSYTIIGVIPASFNLANQVFSGNDVFLPIGQWTNPLLPQRGAGLGIHGIGRLKPGISFEQALTDMDLVSANLAAAYPDVNKGVKASLVPLRKRLLGNVQPFLMVLLSAVSFVLLIACVNVANLLLARSAGRTREFAVRAALGASASRMVRQLLTESVILSAIGGALGLVLAAFSQRLLAGTLLAALPRGGEIKMDFRILLFTTLVSLLCGIVFGLAPALKIAKPDLSLRAREGGHGASRRQHRTQNILVIAEISMALVLLIGAGLMTRSLSRLWSVDVGFDPGNVLTFSMSMPPSMMKTSPSSIRSAFRELDQRLSSIPGIEASSPSWGSVPLQTDDETLFWMEGQPKPANSNDMNWAVSYVTGPDYLKAMKIPLLRGRFFDVHDDERAPQVAVVDEAFAGKFFPNQDPVGKRINLNNQNEYGAVQATEIVGVVKHVKQWSIATDEQSLQPQLYRPFMQLPDEAMALAPSGIGIIVRTKTDAAALFSTIRNAMRQTNAEEVVFAPETMDQTIARSLSSRQYSMILLGIFASLALVLASVGIYGVISNLVGQRTHEMGIRMALGARRSHVLRLVIGHGFRLVTFGLLAGVIASVGLTRLMATLLFDVSATDPATFVVVAGLLTLIALLACYIPARRATRVDPTVALRCE